MSRCVSVGGKYERRGRTQRRGYNRAMARKKLWWPPPLYEARPRLALVAGLIACLGGFGWSLHAGHWTALTTLLIGVGAVLCIYSAVILQLRREYRERSKWTRERGEEG